MGSERFKQMEESQTQESVLFLEFVQAIAAKLQKPEAAIETAVLRTCVTCGPRAADVVVVVDAFLVHLSAVEKRA